MRSQIRQLYSANQFGILLESNVALSTHSGAEAINQCLRNLNSCIEKSANAGAKRPFRQLVGIWGAGTDGDAEPKRKLTFALSVVCTIDAR
jgi:hypothetical protein